MNTVNIRIKKLKENVILPAYALNGDAGLDIYSCENVIINPGERYNFSTGFALEFPEGYCALIWDKSGIAMKRGLKVMGGVFEYTYRGEYMICLLNTSNEAQEFKEGDKIAQILIQPIVRAELIEVDDLSETERGAGKWGSTDK